RSIWPAARKVVKSRNERDPPGHRIEVLTRSCLAHVRPLEWPVSRGVGAIGKPCLAGRQLERGSYMRLRTALYLSAAAVALAALLPAGSLQLQAQTATVAIDNDDIGGVVTGPNGPEAGVWVIAETHDLPTRYAKMVVTDDQGRYVVPDLPKGKYKLWVRGY